MFSTDTQIFTSPGGNFDVSVQTAPLQLSANGSVAAPSGNVADVPEPLPLGLFGVGLGTIGWLVFNVEVKQRKERYFLELQRLTEYM